MSFRSAHRANIFCAKFLPSTDDLQVYVFHFHISFMGL